MYACDCKEWLRSWPKLQNTFTVAWAQDARYDGAAFKNCPWCGAKLRLGLPYTAREQTQIEEEETVELPPKKPDNFIF
ncbi:MAG: hypothetical protein H6636_11030 [Anaerolineales bacterium]|nr:hypothetical protein [Anaerolineales bacterium]